MKTPCICFLTISLPVVLPTWTHAGHMQEVRVRGATEDDLYGGDAGVGGAGSLPLLHPSSVQEVKAPHSEEGCQEAGQG